MKNRTAEKFSNNPEAQLALRLVEESNHNLFLTGKAGTGKSTLLRHIAAHTKKNVAVVAPTGIAALNAKGQTLHSFFRLPFGPAVDIASSGSAFRLRKNKRRILEKLELLIIDEVSMVRADMMDAVHFVLSHFRKETGAFGGVQLLMVGDNFQLPPVLVPKDKPVLEAHYPGVKDFYFFEADVFKNYLDPFLILELQKNYRQESSHFIEALNRVRENKINQDVLDFFNERFDPDIEPGQDEEIITIGTTNRQIDALNETELHKLRTPEVKLKGKTEGDFPRALPVPEELVLKEGAQVMFVKNDAEGKWVNGTLGRVERINLDSDARIIEVRVGNDVLSVCPTAWENIVYEFDEKEDKIKEKVMGSYTHYPLRLAWAVTIHKSQGLTFDKMILDLYRGTWDSGQAYVALSRCRTPEGLYLRRPLKASDIRLSEYVRGYEDVFEKAAEYHLPDGL